MPEGRRSAPANDALLKSAMAYSPKTDAFPGNIVYLSNDSRPTIWDPTSRYIIALVCIIHERAAQRGFEAFRAGCSWSWRSAGRQRRLSSVVDRLGARIWLIPSTLLPGSGAASKRERIWGKEFRGYPLKAPKARAI